MHDPDVSGTIDQDETGYTTQSESPQRVAVRIEEYAHGVRHSAEKGICIAPLLVHVDGEHFQAATPELAIQAVNRRKGADARPTPAGPEVNQHNLSFEVAQSDRRSASRSQLDIGRGRDFGARNARHECQGGDDCQPKYPPVGYHRNSRFSVNDGRF